MESFLNSEILSPCVMSQFSCRAQNGQSLPNWCKYKKCEANPTIHEKICCRNPIIFEDGIFDDMQCITAIEACQCVSLNIYVL